MQRRSGSSAVSARRRRRLGQHFLVDGGAIARIVRAFAPAADDRVLEIGPGRGALTAPLLGRVHRLVAVEIDTRLAAALRRRFGACDDLRILEADALTVDLDHVATLLATGATRSQRMRVIGNLPYRISTPLLARLLARPDLISDLTVMLQREVAARLLARPGDSAYSALSVFVQLHAIPRRLLGLGPRAFSPPPEVSSTVVQLTLREPGPSPELRRAAVAVAEAAFTHRRKMLVNALRESGLESARVDRALALTGLSGRARPQQLAPVDWVHLAAALHDAWPP